MQSMTVVKKTNTDEVRECSRVPNVTVVWCGSVGNAA